MSVPEDVWSLIRGLVVGALFTAAVDVDVCVRF